MILDATPKPCSTVIFPYPPLCQLWSHNVSFPIAKTPSATSIVSDSLTAFVSNAAKSEAIRTNPDSCRIESEPTEALISPVCTSITITCPIAASSSDSLFCRIESTFTCKVLSMVETCFVFCLAQAMNVAMLIKRIIVFFMVVYVNGNIIHYSYKSNMSLLQYLQYCIKWLG